jgi:putative membrane protein
MRYWRSAGPGDARSLNTLESGVHIMWWYAYPGMGWTMILSSLIWLVLIGAAVWALVRWIEHRPRSGSEGGTGVGPSAEEILRWRFARGEIDAATFQAMRAHLASSVNGSPAGAERQAAADRQEDRPPVTV